MNGLVERVRILRPLRHRDFRLLWIGMTASLIGDGIFIVSLAWQVYQLSNAPTALSIVGVAMTVPQIVFLLLGGVVSDRFDRRRVMIAADALRALSLIALGLLSIAPEGTLQIWHVMIVAAVFGAGTAFFGPAFDAIVPQLVPDHDLNQANSLDQFVRPAAARMLGPAVGGWLIAAWGPGTAFLGIGAVQVDGHETAGIILTEDGGLSWRPVGQIRAGAPGWSLAVGATSSTSPR